MTRVPAVLAIASLIGVLSSVAPGSAAAQADPTTDHLAAHDGSAGVVLLVHGLGRTPASMAPLGRELAASGFRVVNVGYDSWREPAEEITALLLDAVDACCAGDEDGVHFVTHSLGGIVVRKFLADHSPAHEGRVVMLSPPNQGSEIVDRLAAIPFLESLLGPTGGDLGTGEESLPNRLGPAHFEVGVITGDRSLNPFYSWLIPGPDDGKVAVDRAALEGASGLLVVPYSHSFIMNREPVVDEVVHFLREGRFSDDAIERFAPPNGSNDLNP